MNLSYLLIICGVVLIVVGLIIWLGLPLGKLPGDIHVKGERSDVYIPIATSILISIALTIAVNAISWLMRK